MHNDKLTVSTHQLFAMFPDQEAARTYLEKRLWPNGCRCPVCGLGERITERAVLYRAFMTRRLLIRLACALADLADWVYYQAQKL